ncbi:MAG: hypothetical protein Q4D54_07130, partial [Eubacteriales bacterium]|nr:hypothetical protein [Eubacteriales bacterium]
EETETEAEEPEEVSEETETEAEESEVVDDNPWNNIKKNSLEFPVFRSSLFPEYHNNEEHVIENHFEEIMEKEHSKLQENLQKEEQMQKEAEALLASLGIDLSSVGSTKNQTGKVMGTKDEASEIVRPTILNKGPSRDELKSSLKIDSTKREILRKLKEYR